MTTQTAEESLDVARRHLQRVQEAGLEPGGWRPTACTWPDDAALAWTREAVEHARSEAAIVTIVATGSAVRDIDSSDDLDLVLVYRSHRPALARPPISVDLRQYEQTDVEPRLAAGHDYLSWTVRFGRALFERDSWWTRLRGEWNGRLSLPAVAESLGRADKARHYFEEMSAAGDASAAAEFELSMLTHLGRAALSRAAVFPKSRPEMADQLRDVGDEELADRLSAALADRSAQRPAASARAGRRHGRRVGFQP